MYKHINEFEEVRKERKGKQANQQKKKDIKKRKKEVYVLVCFYVQVACIFYIYRPVRTGQRTKDADFFFFGS